MSLKTKDEIAPGRRKKGRFPWLPLLILLVSLLVFWGIPYFSPDRGPVRVQFVNSK